MDLTTEPLSRRVPVKGFHKTEGGNSILQGGIMSYGHTDQLKGETRL